MNTLQNNANINEKVIDNLEAIYIKTRNISKEHSVLDYEGDFKETLNDLLVSYNSHAVRVIIKDIDKVNWEVVSKIKKETIYKVLQEFMVNMKKHSQAEFVALTFKIIRKKIIITYSDDGIGTDLKKNTGLQNVENRIRTINGTINFESEINKGFKSKITV
jgi:signal transduction histidine kinase